MLRLVFFGSDVFSVEPLKKLSEAFRVECVITAPPRRSGRGRKLRETPVESLACELGLPVLHPERPEEELEELKKLSPDFFVVAAYGAILGKELLSIPRLGPVNLHPSLLPQLRGASPINWAIIRGLRKTGVTVMLMDEGVDTGPILSQKTIEMDPSWDSQELGSILSKEGAELLVETLDAFSKGLIKPKPQEGEATYAPMLRKEMGLINWELPSESIERKVKGLKPWPMAYTFLRGKRLIVTKGYSGPSSRDAEPGRVLNLGEAIEVKTGEGSFYIERLKPEGKREMRAKEFIAGRNIEEGERLQTPS